MLRPAAPRRGLLVGVAVLVLATPTACGVFGPDELAAGDVVQAQGSSIGDGATVSLSVPGGELLFVVDAHADDVSDADLVGKAVEPADGTHLAGISWKLDQVETRPDLRLLAGLAATKPGSITLEAGDTTAVLDDGWSTSGAVYVAVPDDAELTVAVDFDGVTQSVAAATGEQTVAPEAQLLYEEPATPSEVRCDGEVAPTPGSTADVSCRATLFSAPYAEGVGWSPAGSPWQVVKVDVTLTSVDTGGAGYVAASSQGTVLLDGADPTGVVPGIGDDKELSSNLYVYPDQGSVLNVSREYALTLASGDGPETATFTFESSTALGEVP